MNTNDYIYHSRSILSQAVQIENSKRPAYTGGKDDVLYNFKSVAEKLGITPFQAWGVYALKHFDAIMSYAKDPNIPQGEAMEGRFADAVNYLKLGYALYKETENNPKRFGIIEFDSVMPGN